MTVPNDDLAAARWANAELSRLRAELAEARQERETWNARSRHNLARAEQAERELAEAKREVERLEKLVYVPGLLKCAKCGCSVISTNLHYPSGGFSADNRPKECPNGCGPMWRVTERDCRKRMGTRAGNALVIARAALARAAEGGER